MSLHPGTRLGPYEITAAIGAGGMGEVFKARDTTLNRDVAIKVLPATLATDAERLARFKREAQVLASLSHSNVAHVYGFEAASLPDGTSAHFLAMEMVEGEDLSERLKRGAIPVDEAIAIAHQIAEGLGEAHDHGIIHRDLKPANIKVTAGGKVKILDFGLAKALDGDPSTSAANSQISHSPTMSRHMTEAGMIMGTAAYMSPEQARGKIVDKRADIWSFGVVLFEMLTGQRLFSGETVSDTLAAVLTRDPDWTALPICATAGIERLLRRCLERDPRRRLHDIADARFDLDDPAPRPGELVGEIAPGGRGDAKFFSRNVLPWGVAGLAVVLAIAGGSFTKKEPALPTQIATSLYRDNSLFSPTSGIAISPDGTLVVYADTTDEGRGLFARPLSGIQARFIKGSEDGTAPFFSPDGKSIAFFSLPAGSGVSNFRTVRLEGGSPIEIIPGVNTAAAGFIFTGQWAANGEIVYSGVGPTLQRVSAAGGTPTPASVLDEARREQTHVQAQLLPDGKTIVYVAAVAGGRKDIVAARIGEGPGKVLIEGATSPRYLALGYLVFERQGSLLIAPFDAQRREFTGEPVVVVEGVKVAVYGSYRQAQFDFSANGTLVYLQDLGDFRISDIVWVDRQGRATPAFDEPGSYLVPRISPEGARIAYAAVDPKSGERALWVRDLERGTRTRLNFGKGLATDPVWSPDGREIAFSSTRDSGSLQLYRGSASGEGDATQLSRSVNPDAAIFARAWLKGGGILFDDQAGGSKDVGLLDPESGDTRAILSTRFEELEATLSTDGRFMAYVSDESGRREVYVRPFEGQGGRVQVSADGGDEPVWSPKGDELFYRAGDHMMVVPVSTTGTIHLGIPSTLFEGQFEVDPFNNDARNYDVSKDGRRFLMVRRRPALRSQGEQLNVVVNWFSELKARMAAK